MHRWERPVINYHEIMVIYPYHFLVITTQSFSWIIFINDCIGILTGPHGYYLLMIIYVIQKLGVNDNSPTFINVMVNYHYHWQKQVNYPIITVYT